jgi:hypothetical protein
MTKIISFVLITAAFLLTPSLYAAEGEVTLSSTDVECIDAEKERNVLASGGTGRIWVNVPAAKTTVGLQYVMEEEGNVIVNPTTFSLDGCGDGYHFADITLPAVQGSITIHVKDSEGNKIGSDTFILE